MLYHVKHEFDIEVEDEGVALVFASDYTSVLLTRQEAGEGIYNIHTKVNKVEE